VVNFRQSILADYSGLMFAVRITLPHFSVSSDMNFPKAAGESTSCVLPKSASRALILGSARPALISLPSLSMISAGVFLGAPAPVQPIASKPGRQQTYSSAKGDELRADLADRRSVILAEIGDRLVIGNQPPGSHITSTLRPASRSSRRLD
jgi:hypothetical protein